MSPGAFPVCTSCRQAGWQVTARQLLLHLPRLPSPTRLWQVMRGMQSPKIMSKKILLLTVRPESVACRQCRISVSWQFGQQAEGGGNPKPYRKSNSLQKFLGLKRWQHVISLLSCRMTHTHPTLAPPPISKKRTRKYRISQQKYVFFLILIHIHIHIHIYKLSCLAHKY